jgi:hypothetical protein
MTKLFTAIEMTAQEIKTSEGREYNAREWNRIIDRLSKYENVRFFQVAPGNGYSYYRYFASYTVPEGLNFFGSVSYSSCLSSNGFSLIMIEPTGNPNEVAIFNHLFIINGKEVWAANTPSNRKALVHKSKEYGAILTNNF